MLEDGLVELVHSPVVPSEHRVVVESHPHPVCGAGAGDDGERHEQGHDKRAQQQLHGRVLLGVGAWPSYPPVVRSV
jgi:hypothetical protein